MNSNTDSSSDDENGNDSDNEEVNDNDDIDADELRHLEQDNDASGSAILLSSKRQPQTTHVLHTSTMVSTVADDLLPSDNEGNERDSVHRSTKSVTSQISSTASSQASASTSPSSSESSSASSESGGESDDEFNDGFDDDLMGDASDRARLESLTEKERETEIFKRIERRDVMKTRWEIKRKLRLAKRNAAAERVSAETADRRPPKAPKTSKGQAFLAVPATARAGAATGTANHHDKSFVLGPSITAAKWLSPSPIVVNPFEPIDFVESDDTDREREYFDPKERSKERKKNVEANRTDDKRSSAMAMLKAKREDKAKRGNTN